MVALKCTRSKCASSYYTLCFVPVHSDLIYNFGISQKTLFKELLESQVDNAKLTFPSMVPIPPLPYPRSRRFGYLKVTSSTLAIQLNQRTYLRTRCSGNFHVRKAEFRSLPFRVHSFSIGCSHCFLQAIALGPSIFSSNSLNSFPRAIFALSHTTTKFFRTVDFRILGYSSPQYNAEIAI